jgi:uncharacterized protein YciI
MHYVLLYDFTSDYLERRAPYRSEHLRLAWEAHRRGELVLGGALAEPVDSALLLFDCESAEIPQRFAAADPYVQQGIVRSYRIRPWTTVVGEDAATPVRPE